MCSIKRIKRAFAFSAVLAFVQLYAFGQSINEPDSFYKVQHNVISQPKRITYKSFILPAALITTGALDISDHFIIPDGAIKEERDEDFPHFHTTIDNYLQFAPMLAGYAMLINNGQHSYWKYTEKVALTEVMLNALVQPVKHITKEPRPDTGAPTSFPSGHTTEAFAGATIFCDEFAEHKPLLTASMYTAATAVGALRVLNNRHWANDVVAGAGFGILSAKLSELIIEPHGKKYHSSYNNQL